MSRFTCCYIFQLVGIAGLMRSNYGRAITVFLPINSIFLIFICLARRLVYKYDYARARRYSQQIESRGNLYVLLAFSSFIAGYTMLSLLQRCFDETEEKTKQNLYLVTIFFGLAWARSIYDYIGSFEIIEEREQNARPANINLDDYHSSMQKRKVQYFDNEDKSKECSICYDVIKKGAELSCKHVFCRTCLESWHASQRKRNCPYCRQ